MSNVALKYEIPDYQGREVRNFVLQNLASNPTPYGGGHPYFNTSTQRLRVYDATATAWIEMGAGTGGVTDVAVATAHGFSGTSDHNATTPTITLNCTITGLLKGNGTSMVAAVSGTDYAPATSGSGALKGDGAGGFGAATINDLAAQTADYSANSHKITSLTAGTNPGDAVNYAQLTAAIQGVETKPTADIAATAALPANTYANGTSGIGATLTGNSNGALTAQDGETPTVGLIYLVMGEVAGSHNGEYVLTQVGDGSHPYILTRHVDMDESAEFGGALVAIRSGTARSGRLYLCSTAAPTVGTTTISFAYINSPVTYTAGNGIDITTFAISVRLATGGGLEFNSGQIRIKANEGGKVVDLGTIGNASSTSFTITHNLGVQYVDIMVFKASGGARVSVPYTCDSTTAGTVDFGSYAPASNEFEVKVLG